MKTSSPVDQAIENARALVREGAAELRDRVRQYDEAKDRLAFHTAQLRAVEEVARAARAAPDWEAMFRLLVELAAELAPGEGNKMLVLVSTIAVDAPDWLAMAEHMERLATDLRQRTRRLQSVR